MVNLIKQVVLFLELLLFFEIVLALLVFFLDDLHLLMEIELTVLCGKRLNATSYSYLWLF